MFLHAIWRHWLRWLHDYLSKDGLPKDGLQGIQSKKESSHLWLHTPFAGTMVLREKFQGSNPGWQVWRVISTETDQINGALPLVLQKNDSTAKRSRNRKSGTKVTEPKIKFGDICRNKLWSGTNIDSSLDGCRAIKSNVINSNVKLSYSFVFPSTFSLVMPSLAPRLKNMPAALKTSFLQMMVLAQSS